MTSPTDEEPTSALLGGRYALHESIGRGAMAEVFRADDVVLGRTVAVKMLRTAPDGSLLAPRARTEMSLLASLNHHSLVTLYDAMVAPGHVPYLVMELVDGPTLAERLHDGPMDAGEVAQLGAQLASALHVVHEAGIVHRDVKPSNILLATDPVPGRRPRAKLADFGVAYLADGERFTSPGMVIGTAAYLAPEQVRGAQPAPPADIYSLGLVLREALTGERAFPDATGIGAITARLIESPGLPDDLGEEWVALLGRMIAFDPEDRPTALEVAELAAELPTGPALLRPTSAVTAAFADSPSAAREIAASAPTAAYPAHPHAPVALPAVPPLPPLPPLPAAAEARTTDLVARRDRAPRRRRRRTRTLVLIGSALAAVAVLGVNAAQWVGSVDGGPTTVQNTPAPTGTLPADDELTIAEDLAPTDPEVATVSTDTGDANTVSDSTATKEPRKGSSAGAAKNDDKAAEKAQRDADKAAEKAQRDADKAAEKAQREARKQADAAKKAAEKAERERQRAGDSVDG